ncbi:AraC family transcriptional regulator [Paractinoplanes deccanensis]|uniref:AraC family transcriptional regulator n=2 Tax=Paractinoplanes deccanensis TaxID=113561 RepID=A0ABQ3XUM0_9ACTN|nr:helix-turn-helix domain-containing protein [Actinoplanes deccanensis]GID71385.1 AraC family transcriptional regulator [Actinoplanes deccanensis]
MSGASAYMTGAELAVDGGMTAHVSHKGIADAIGARRQRVRAGYLVPVAATRLNRVAVLVLEGAKPLDVGIPAQVFTTRASMPYEVRVCGARPGLVTGGDGLSYHVADGLDALRWADIAFIPGYRHPDREDPPGPVVEALRAAHQGGTRLAAISTGAFALAATGLLDGKRATTHWHYTRQLAAKHPEVRVDENVLFVDEGSVLTSAGAASGIDLCLHILRGDLGVAASNHAARRLVAAPYRSGGQAQYVPRSVPEPLGERFAATREWALHRLSKPLTLEILARHAAVSARTFSRRFVEDTGYTPMQWVMRARIDMARELLERSERSVEQIAADVGLGTGANLRLHFRQILGTTPSEYRHTFARNDVA